jgi:hypothetical protein
LEIGIGRLDRAVEERRSNINSDIVVVVVARDNLLLAGVGVFDCAVDTPTLPYIEFRRLVA